MTSFRSRTRLLLAAASSLALLVVIGVVGYRLLLPAGKTAQNMVAAPTPTVAIADSSATLSLTDIVPPSVETITLYPGVRDVSYLVDQGNGRGWSVKGNYIADATAPQLLQYYDDTLGKFGWILDATSSTPTGEAPGGDLLLSHEYFWADVTKTVPWNLTLEISADQAHQQDSQAAQITKVQATLSREPSLGGVAFYPSARQIETHSESSSTIRGFGKTYFSYVVDATPDEVRAYYEKVAPQSGWKVSDEGHDIMTDGIFYEWHGGGTKQKRDTYLTIRAKPASQGQTTVQIILAVQLIPR